MILLLGGTTESIQIAKRLKQCHIPFILSTATKYGKEIAQESIDALVVEGRMDEVQMESFCKQRAITSIVDATHPYAQLVSAYAIKVSQVLGLKYYRYEREEKAYEDVRMFNCYEEVGAWLNDKKGNILVTTGSKDIATLRQCIKDPSRLFIRFLPTSEQIQKMEGLGFLPKQLLALQGPFDIEMNKAMLQMTKASYLITKESGSAGKVEEKIIAAREMGVEVLMIKRPTQSYPHTFSTIEEMVKHVQKGTEKKTSLAVITLTPGGLRQAQKLKQRDASIIVYTKKELGDPTTCSIEGSFKECVKHLFETYEVLVFIMATGIVVRTLAPYLNHKSVDPAVLVMDEKGAYIISLLSGHLGGANFWTTQLAKWIDAAPVITTASDVNSILGIDLLAKKLGCAVTDFESAKDLMAKKLEGKCITIDTGYQIPEDIQRQYPLDQHVNGAQGVIYIGEKPPKDYETPFIWLIPRTVVVGIGCKKDKSYQEIRNAVEEAFKSVGYPLESLKSFATIEIKKEEKGLVILAKKLNVPLISFSVEEIKKVQEKFKGSDFVEKTVGVRAVSEPVGYLASQKGECIFPLQKSNGMTVSLWKESALFYEK